MEPKYDDIYSNDIYLEKHPNLHEEDSLWKIRKIIPLLDKFIEQNTKHEINLLDVGGGSGLILKEVSNYIQDKCDLKINKFALDLSPMMLEIQKKNNTDLKIALIEDISNTSLKDKEIDITLMIDVLEHVKDPKKVLAELNRISRFVLFKVPLENNMFYNLLNILTRNRIRTYHIENFGHIQCYNSKTLKLELKQYSDELICYHYSNVSEFSLNRFDGKNMDIKGKTMKIIDILAVISYKLSPEISSKLFFDYAMVLIKC